MSRAKRRAWAPENNGNWKTALRAGKMFIYWKLEMTPTYSFSKAGEGSEWKGHGQSFRSIAKMMDWVAAQPEKD